MSPMMQPAPRPIGRRKPASPQPVAKGKRSEKGRLAIVAACLGLALGFVAIAAMGAWGETGGRRPVPLPTPEQVEAQARRIVEIEDKWFESLETQTVSPQVAAALRANPYTQPGHIERRTGNVLINMRTLESRPAPPDSEEGRKPPPELETSSTVNQPVLPPEGEGAAEPPPGSRLE